MNYCSNCGKEIAVDDAFCTGCGFPVNAVSQENKVELPKPTITIGLNEQEFQSVVLNKTFRSTRGAEKKFPLSGKELIISADMDAFNEYRLAFRELAKICADTAAREYTEKVNNLETFISFFPEIYEKYLAVMGDKAIEVLVSESIYSVTREDLLVQHKADFHLATDDYETISESIQLTVQQNRAASGALQSFASKYVNNKFGVSEEDFASMTDTMLDEAAQKLNDEQKYELYGRITPHFLFERVFFDYWRMFLTLVTLLRGFGVNLWWPDDATCENANNIFKNISNPNFPQDKICDVLFDIILANPYNAKYYDFIKEKFGDTEEATKIQTYFGYPDFGDKVYSENDIPKNQAIYAVAPNDNSKNASNGNLATDTFKAGAEMLKGAFKSASDGVGGIFKGFGKFKK